MDPLGHAVPDANVPNGGSLDADRGPGDGTEQQFVDLNFWQVAFKLFLRGPLQTAKNVEIFHRGAFEYKVSGGGDTVAA